MYIIVQTFKLNRIGTLPFGRRMNHQRLVITDSGHVGHTRGLPTNG